MTKNSSHRCLSYDFEHIRHLFKRNLIMLRTYTTKRTSTDDECSNSDENEQGHSPAYYEQYRQVFQHQSAMPNNADQDQHEYVPKKSEIILTNNTNKDKSAVPKESSGNVVKNNKENQFNADKPELTHTDSSGKVKMVDVGDKPETKRTAKAYGTIRLGKDAYGLVKDNKLKKGDVLSVAQIAGIMAAKQTSSIIPLCHTIPISKIDLDLTLVEDNFSVEITSEVTSHGKTGVEMEALTAVAVAALTVYDMCKAVTHDMVLCDIKLLRKEGGQRGTFNRKS